MKRSGPIARTSWLARGTKRVKARNPKRAAKNHARAYGPPERIAFVQALPCIVRYCPRPSVNAHVGNTGAGVSRKADADQIAPLCDVHHRLLDDEMGAADFERVFGLSLADCAARTDAAWQRSLRSRGAPEQ